MALMTEAGLQAHLDERQVTICQKCLGLIHSKLDQVLMRTGAGGLFEFARKMKATHARLFSQIVEPQIMRVVLSYEFLYMPQFLAR